MSLLPRIYRERRGLALPVLLLLGINVAVLAAGVLPLRQSVAAARDDAHEAAQVLSEALAAEREARQARTRKDEADEQLREFYAGILPTDLNGARRLTQLWLYQVARDASVQFDAGQYEYAPVRESQLTRVASKVALKGEYGDVRRFLYDVETAPEFVIVEKVELAQAGTALQGTTGTLELVLEVSTFFLTSPAGSGR